MIVHDSSGQIYNESESDQIFFQIFDIWNNGAGKKWGVRYTVWYIVLLTLCNGDRRIVQCMIRRRISKPGNFRTFIWTLIEFFANVLTFFHMFVEWKGTILDVVPKCKEGEANEETQRSAKVRDHGYKVIIVNLKAIDQFYIVVTMSTPSVPLVLQWLQLSQTTM